MKNTTETLLARERRVRELSFKELGDVLGVSRQAAQRYCTPRGHEHHRRLSREAAEALRRMTGGQITVDNYDEPADPPAKPSKAKRKART